MTALTAAWFIARCNDNSSMSQDQVAVGDETQETTMLPALVKISSVVESDQGDATHKHTEKRNDGLLAGVFLYRGNQVSQVLYRKPFA